MKYVPNYTRRAKLMNLTAASLATLEDLSFTHAIPARHLHHKTLAALRARGLIYLFVAKRQYEPSVLLSARGKKLLERFPAMRAEETVETYLARLRRR